MSGVRRVLGRRRKRRTPVPARRLYALAVILVVAVTSGYRHWTEPVTAASPPPGVELRCRVLHVDDGDSVRADCGAGEIRVRIHGIDAPEMGQAQWGAQARRALRRMLGEEVTLQVRDVDHYGRTVASLHDGERDLGLELVRRGHAVMYRRYNDDPRYDEAEREARRRGLGVWAEPGPQQQPWTWRRVNPHREAAGGR